MMSKREIYKKLFYTTGKAPQHGAHKVDKYCKLILPEEYKNKLDSKIQYIWCIHMDGISRKRGSKIYSNYYDSNKKMIVEKCNEIIKFNHDNGYRLAIDWKEENSTEPYAILGIFICAKRYENKRSTLKYVRSFKLIKKYEKNHSECFKL